jgi:hypothetical protein
VERSKQCVRIGGSLSVGFRPYSSPTRGLRRVSIPPYYAKVVRHDIAHDAGNRLIGSARTYGDALLIFFVIVFLLLLTFVIRVWWNGVAWVPVLAREPK